MFAKRHREDRIEGGGCSRDQEGSDAAGHALRHGFATHVLPAH